MDFCVMYHAAAESGRVRLFQTRQRNRVLRCERGHGLSESRTAAVEVAKGRQAPTANDSRYVWGLFAAVNRDMKHGDITVSEMPSDEGPVLAIAPGCVEMECSAIIFSCTVRGESRPFIRAGEFESNPDKIKKNN